MKKYKVQIPEVHYSTRIVEVEDDASHEDIEDFAINEREQNLDYICLLCELGDDIPIKVSITEI